MVRKLIEWSLNNPLVVILMGVAFTAVGKPVVDGWVEVCDSGKLLKADVVRFVHRSVLRIAQRREE